VRDYLIRTEIAGDEPLIREVTRRAFEGRPYSDGHEPDIIDALRVAGALAISLVVIVG
jgi:putative acetyltransferase